MAPLRPRSRPWLAATWIAGTAAAVTIAVVAVNLAGAGVTGRPIPTVSRHGVEVALAGDATTLTADHRDGTVADQTVATDDHGATGSASTGLPSVSGHEDDHSGTSGSSGSSGSGSSGSSGAVSPSGSGSSGSSGSDDGLTGGGSTTGHDDGSGSSGGGSGSTPGGGGGSTPTTAPAAATFTTTVEGNTVTVRCSGATVALVSTVAAAGSAKQIRKTGPDEVDVRFTSAADDDVEVQATCSASVVRWDS